MPAHHIITLMYNEQMLDITRMSRFAFQVLCLQLVAIGPLVDTYGVPVDWLVLRQNLSW